MTTAEYVGLIFTVIVIWGGGFGVMLGMLKNKVSKDVCAERKDRMDRQDEMIDKLFKMSEEHISACSSLTQAVENQNRRLDELTDEIRKSNGGG